MEDRDTVGKLSSELLPMQSDNSHSAEEQMREQLTDWDKNINEAIYRGLKDFPHDFHLVVITKKERLMQNVIRNYFAIRESCPSPEYDQTVYRYYRKTDVLKFLWVIPSKDTCEFFKYNALQIDTSEKELLNYVLEFYDGTLEYLAKKYNGEIDET